MAKEDISFISVLEDTKLMEDSAVSFPAVDPAIIDSYRADDLNARALERLMADLKAGRLGAAHLSQLRQIAAALPADVASLRGETPRETGEPRTAPARARNFRAEYALAAMRLGLPGVTP